MKNRFTLFSFIFFFLAFFQTLALAATTGEPFKAAREAVRAGDKARFERLVPKLQGQGLDAYIEYWRLLLDMRKGDHAPILSFLSRYDKQYIAEQLRSDWLRHLGLTQQWALFDSQYPALVQPNQELRCFAMLSRLSRGDASVFNEAMPMWFTLADPPEPCVTVLETLVTTGRVRVNDVWTRVRLQFEATRLRAARQTVRHLPKNETPDPRVMAVVIDTPLQWLAKNEMFDKRKQTQRELAILAVSRIARSDPHQAARSLTQIQNRLEASEIEWAWSQIAWRGAMRHIPEALDWYGKAGETQLSDSLIQWKARIALRNKNWTALQGTIQSMRPELASNPTWIYWHGRALREIGKTREGNTFFEKIAGQPHFYGHLAGEELGQLVTAPKRTTPSTREELERISTNPGILRSLALFRVDLRVEAVREWNWAMRGLDDRGLLAAATVAMQAHVYDRAISSADRTRTEHNFFLRYPAPFKGHISQAARNQALDEAWVYGLIRQESRFIINAKSSAGASGLMQLMPNTARWVARRIGIKDYHHSQVNNLDINLRLGTAYLRMVLEDLGSPILALAAYNAGPERARRWQADHPLEAAIYMETIPFSETRDYVKRVMSNTIYYAALFEGKDQSIKRRLVPIGPRVPTDPKAEKLP